MELTDRKTDAFAYRPLYRLKLQLPAGYSPASMRRSQSAVQATADYLGTRVARLSYLNPDEANKKYLYLQSPQKVNDKGKFKLHVRQRENQAVCACCFVVFVEGGGACGLYRGISRQDSLMKCISGASISAINRQLKGQVLPCVCGKEPVRWATVQPTDCASLMTLESGDPGGENTD